MARYQIPQFIEVEDKIFGPLTFRQFIYLIGAGGFAVVIFRILPTFWAVLVSMPIVILGLALAFYKVNNKPFVFILEAAFRYATGGKLYVWKKEAKKKKAPQKMEVENKVYVPRLSESKLDDLAWGLDINDKLNSEENAE